MLGVAILIIVMSVMNGFRAELTQKILVLIHILTIKPYDQISDNFYNRFKKKYKDSKIIKTFNGEAVIITTKFSQRNFDKRN